jgi:hypothetical protein
MEDGFDIAVKLPGMEQVDELVLVQVIDNVAIDEMIRSTPRSLSDLTMLEPMKPAAPVTMVYMIQTP